jgi:hypothetical protein
MTTNLSTVNVTELNVLDLDRVVGGANPDFNAIKEQARPYCPITVARYSNVDPSTINRTTAQQMGNACLAEMGPFKASFARGRINSAIDQAFPPRH